MIEWCTVAADRGYAALSRDRFSLLWTGAWETVSTVCWAAIVVVSGCSWLVRLGGDTIRWWSITFGCFDYLRLCMKF